MDSLFDREDAEKEIVDFNEDTKDDCEEKKEEKVEEKVEVNDSFDDFCRSMSYF